MQPSPQTSPSTFADACIYCGRHCRVPISRGMPAAVQAVYIAAGRYELATCDAGAAAEKVQLGVSYTDVVEARIHDLHAPGRAAQGS